MTSENYEPNGIRFNRYKRDKSRRGRSLTLAQILIHLSRQDEYADFAEYLDSTSRLIRQIGMLDATAREKRIVVALRSFASEIGEICEETNLQESDALKILENLVTEKTVVVRYRNNFCVLGEPSVPLYFLAEMVADISDDLDLFPSRSIRNARATSRARAAL